MTLLYFEMKMSSVVFIFEAGVIFEGTFDVSGISHQAENLSGYDTVSDADIGGVGVVDHVSIDRYGSVIMSDGDGGSITTLFFVSRGVIGRVAYDPSTGGEDRRPVAETAWLGDRSFDIARDVGHLEIEAFLGVTEVMIMALNIIGDDIFSNWKGDQVALICFDDAGDEEESC